MDEWPTSPKDDFGRRDYFTALRSSEAPPEYFIVIKRFEEQTVVNWKEDKILRGIAKNFRVMAKDDDYVVFDLLEKRGQCSRMFERPPSLLIDRDANEVGFTKYAQRPLRTRKGQRKDMTIGSKKILKTSLFGAHILTQLYDAPVA
jgi:hypothetical protein